MNNLDTKQLLELVSSQMGIETKLDLFIKYPNNNYLLLEEKECPFSICDSLFFIPIDKKDKENPYECHLIATPKKKNNRSFVSIPVIDENSNFLYMMPFLSTSKSFHMDAIINLMQSIHQSPDTSISIYSKNDRRYGQNDHTSANIK